jgi:UDP-N-acetylglucosamine 1-carboxyvinyltransferase
LKHGYVHARTEGLVGTTIDLSGPAGSTVTGTANVLSAAVLAQGTTTITGAAMEPEIVELGSFLNAMGARVGGLGTPVIRVNGVKRLDGTTWRVTADRIEAATILLSAAISGGAATVTGVVPEHLEAVIAGLRTAGLHVDVENDRVTLIANGRPQAMDVTAQPYPGVPTDVQAQWTALLCLARGRSVVQDCVFPNRFLHVAELKRMGARIRHCPPTAVVTGVKRLEGAVVTASDLRASAALVLAGLAAEGQTVVRHIHHLDRGYERLDDKLRRLGARIERVEDGETAG